jgi:hypothetical protein
MGDAIKITYARSVGGEIMPEYFFVHYSCL